VRVRICVDKHQSCIVLKSNYLFTCCIFAGE
jgi:hypothetical protein